MKISLFKVRSYAVLNVDGWLGAQIFFMKIFLMIMKKVRTYAALTVE